jgi:hypothetical protein
MEEKRRGYSERDVDAWPGERHQDHVAARMAQGIKIDRHGFSVAEQHGRPHEQKDRRHQDRAKKVDVLERIESNAGQAIGGVVAQVVGNEAVRSFVQCDGDQDRQLLVYCRAVRIARCGSLVETTLIPIRQNHA